MHRFRDRFRHAPVGRADGRGKWHGGARCAGAIALGLAALIPLAAEAQHKNWPPKGQENTAVQPQRPMPTEAQAQPVMQGKPADPRLGPLEAMFLGQSAGQFVQQVAKAAASAEVERQDKEAAQARLKAVEDFWRQWCGDRPGCATPEKKETAP